MRTDSTPTTHHWWWQALRRGGAAMSVSRAWVCAALVVLALRPGAADLLRPECPEYPPGAPLLCSQQEEIKRGEFNYKVPGGSLVVTFIAGDSFEVECEDGAKLEIPSLPCFPYPVAVNVVSLAHCPAPQNGSYADILAAFNVTSYSTLRLDYTTGNLTGAHFAGLHSLEILDVYRLHNGTLALDQLCASSDLHALRILRLNTVRTSQSDLCRLPRSLEVLKLWYTGLKHAHVHHLPKLRTLDFAESFIADVNVSASDALQELSIDMPITETPREEMPLSLRILKYSGWRVSNGESLSSAQCAHLETFSVSGVRRMSTVSLPSAWVARCPELSELSISAVPVRDALPASLLRNASALRKFSCTKCALSQLSLWLFNETLSLQHVDLSENKITFLPGGLFVHTQSLETLNLSHNQLTSSVADSLAAVRSLQVLRLNHNRDLGDLCETGNAIMQVDEPSPLSARTNLTELYLHDTNIKHVCGDWRDTLQHLRLLHMNPIAFENLTLTDMIYRRAIDGAKVYLGKLGKFKLLYSRDDYENVYNGSTSVTSKFQASVTITGSLQCNCQTYWAALALRSKNHPHVQGLRCGSKLLSKVDLDTLTCDAREQCSPLRLPAACTCAARDDLEHGAVVIVTCERANLTELPRLPRLPRAPHKWRLHLAYNNISTIHAANVSSDIVELDLRNNSIKRLDGETAAKLAGIRLKLAGNQLECGCEAFEMLTALLSTTSRLNDSKIVMCAGGKSITAAPRVPCASFVGPTLAGLAVLLGTAIAVVGLLAQPKTRRHIKTILISIGWLPPRPEPKSDCNRIFDAFVSYAHEDEDFVVEQLQEKLEGGAQPYRLCLHYRDWAPGEWIPAQISASVRSSRRTVAVVSQHYIRSSWARAEFREAHAATLRDEVPRLVLILLADPDTLPLDAELNAYVRHNTYVRWGDPWFWPKLRQALAPPRICNSQKSAALPALPTLPSSAATPAPPAPRNTPSSALPAPLRVPSLAISL